MVSREVVKHGILGERGSGLRVVATTAATGIGIWNIYVNITHPTGRAGAKNLKRTVAAVVDAGMIACLAGRLSVVMRS